ncbi:hypothetical protein [Paraburkholderia azotifigens]|uniref:Uncharacterized protein n=1 Tax=Paraburkholderia azotifigens TaxID=2057004 RepID=A0A5C6VU85_9BURK|nr:hypothetical protein [Paraburkholderia azotifigens]TXC88480.1 hypothetical protein FRZ40_13275 [Paraburkholderia azotifigens]
MADFEKELKASHSLTSAGRRGGLTAEAPPATHRRPVTSAQMYLSYVSNNYVLLQLDRGKFGVVFAPPQLLYGKACGTVIAPEVTSLASGACLESRQF